MEQHEPYLLTSLIRKLTELLHEHGDLPVYSVAEEGDQFQLSSADVEDKMDDIIFHLPKRVVIQ